MEDGGQLQPSHRPRWYTRTSGTGRPGRWATKLAGYARIRPAGAVRWGAALALGGVAVVAALLALRAAAQGDYVAVITVDGAIDRGSERYLSRAMGDAEADGVPLVVIEVDTPGGLLDATREMVETILNARVPVAVYVAPQGARAASAGTFITAAANFAAMAPGTNIGAASPISSTGEDIGETLAKKINEDTRAFVRSIAEKRGRSSEALEATVTLARSYSATEALELGVVDLIAADRAELLRLLEGRTAETAGGAVVVRTEGLPVRELGKSLLEQFLSILADPNIAGLLITVGGLAILVEIVVPGHFGPGIGGTVALALGLVGAGQLPTNWVALGLIGLAMVLFFIELQAAGFGIFGIGGLICLVTGLFFLFGNITGSPDIPEPSFSVSPWVAITMAAMGGAFVVALAYAARTTGSAGGSPADQALVGRPGIALTDLVPSGRVDVSGEEWTATTDPGSMIREGDAVRVLGVYGEVVKVARLVDTPPEQGTRLRDRWRTLLRGVPRAGRRR